MRKILIYSREDFEKLSFNDNDYYIPINPSHGPYLDPILEDSNTVCNLYFEDVLEDGERIDPIYGKHTAKAIDKENAKKLIQFANDISENANVHIHCTHGESRSPAVGLFLTEYYKQDDRQFMKLNNFDTIDGFNATVLRVLRES
tara:strand:+ start:3045 stop:3479 length:435 start_codon:yes stop_codon:yes gene_type:complete